LRKIKADMASGWLKEAQHAAERASSEFQLVEHQQGLWLLQAELLLLQGALHAAIKTYDDLLASSQKQLPAVLSKRQQAQTHTVTLTCAEDLASNISSTLCADQSPTCCGQVPAAALVLLLKNVDITRVAHRFRVVVAILRASSADPGSMLILCWYQHPVCTS
jgi:hypothetical protein